MTLNGSRKEIQSGKTDDLGVYHKLRLSKPVPGVDGKMKWTINGISANSWFTPYGIIDKKEISTAPYGPVTDEIRVCLQERAQSAAGFLGRRHYEIDKQNLKTNEILRGRKIDLTGSCVRETESEVFQKSKRCWKCASENKKTDKERILLQRPHTSYCIRPRPMMDTDGLRPKVESLTIREKSFNRQEHEEGDKIELSDITVQCENETDASEKRTEETFRNPREMKVAYEKRVQSAPPIVRQRQSFETEVTASARTHSTPLYWKTRSIYHRKNIAENTSDDQTDRSVFFSKGSLLKPLLYQKGDDLKHSAGCPYKCKGCFRACLASQDYLNELRKKRAQSIRQVRQYQHPVRPKFYHRRLIEIAIAKSQPVNQLIQHKDRMRKQ